MGERGGNCGEIGGSAWRMAGGGGEEGVGVGVGLRSAEGGVEGTLLEE